ncbi:zinc dependent phospholipase C family protein [Lacihabitans soyangensis]|uniref:Integrase n=1 Tax=Lacihabitans soyangensis TaxID=869394 RepID=A0AAE3H5I7_9BACT|nr:zinc dependent phospholipase C family protein [Lacihabitans soyangensis]MCP9763410.1 integrase [Lacihabitans soyangensis]
MLLNFYLTISTVFFPPKPTTDPPVWGFYAHSLINRLAVYSLPNEMLGFFKQNIDYVTDNSVNPDQRRYAVVGEAPRHFIDLDDYPDSIRVILPKLSWAQAKEKFSEDSLLAHGIVPWQIQRMTFQLTQAFLKKDNKDILRIATDLGHYIADSNVPLHTTRNYNGQLTNQLGIHGFWESRLPELYSKDYDLLIGKAEYENNIQKRSWSGVLNANAALDSVLLFEKMLTEKIDEEKKFTIEERNGVTVRAYSRNFSKEYHKMLDNQVERQMKASVKMISDIWFTAWVDAGQPDLKAIPKLEVDPKEEQEIMKAWLQRLLNVRKEADN